MCKIGLGVTFRVGNGRKPLKNFEQVKCFLFVCIFSAFCVLLKSKGEQYNTYNENHCFRFLHDDYDYNHSVDNSASLESPPLSSTPFNNLSNLAFPALFSICFCP